ncbi:unnamed protein product [Cochlearia groenlandica]
MKLFDAHCHLQDKRVIENASKLISIALSVGVTNFAVNGTSELIPCMIYLLHSFNGSAEVVPKLAELGAYFSFSGWFTYIDQKIAKNTLKSIPCDRFLLETDSPDGLPKSDDSSSDPKQTLNEPANILVVLDYVANLSNMKKEELAELTYGNTVKLFSYPGSSLLTGNK